MNSVLIKNTSAYRKLGLLHQLVIRRQYLIRNEFAKIDASMLDIALRLIGRRCCCAAATANLLRIVVVVQEGILEHIVVATIGSHGAV